MKPTRQTLEKRLEQLEATARQKAGAHLLDRLSDAELLDLARRASDDIVTWHESKLSQISEAERATFMPMLQMLDADQPNALYRKLKAIQNQKGYR